MIIHSPIFSGSITQAESAIANLSGSFSGSFTGIGNFVGLEADSVEFNNVLNKPSLVSGSSQVSYPSLSNIPSGIISSSAQIDTLFNIDGLVSGASQVDITFTTGTLDIATRTNLQTNGTATINLVLEPSMSILYADAQGGIISSSAQVDADSITNFDTNVKDKLNTDGVISGSSQIVGILSSLNTYTGSNDTKWDTLGSLSGSFARTNSTNIFSGNQTITGSLFVSQDLIVQGSSSIQNISSSVLNIGTNIITVAVNQPSVRFGGLAVIDSGSVGQSGSFLYDSVQDEFIFVHRGDGTNITSSHFVLGPETYNNLGNETYLTNNRVSKGTGKEHLVDSNITDNGTTITLGSNTVVTGTLLATGTALVSGSSQITYASISSIPAGIVSGSSQIDVASTTGDIALGTRTSGNYVASLVQGTGVTITNNSGEGTTPTIAIGQAVATNSEVQFAKVGVGGVHDATYELKVTGDIGATGDIVAYVSSDERLKNNVEVISNPIEKVQSLRGVTWEWNELASDAAKQSPNVGVIAQEVEKVLPQLVHDRENGFKGVDYAKLTGLLIEAIKEQQKQIDELKSRL